MRNRVIAFFLFFTVLFGTFLATGTTPADAATKGVTSATITLDKRSNGSGKLLVCTKLKGKKCVGTKKVIKRGQKTIAQGFYVGNGYCAKATNSILWWGAGTCVVGWHGTLGLNTKVRLDNLSLI